jgi:site-specific DNA-methyltransferase (adenine-specific)
MNPAMFSSTSDEWRTPPDLFAHLNDIYQFDLDPASTHDNHVCRLHCTLEDLNGLKFNWAERRVFLNPPFSQVQLWVAKCIAEMAHCPVIVALLPARTDTRWFQKYVLSAGAVYYIPGRLKFVGAANSAPFPSCIWVLTPPWPKGLGQGKTKATP